MSASCKFLRLFLFFLLFSSSVTAAAPGYTAGISLSPGNTIALIAPASPSPESIAPPIHGNPIRQRNSLS